MRHWIKALASSIVLAVVADASAEINYATVALSGRSGVYGPGLGSGVTFGTINSAVADGPILNQHGDVAFISLLNDSAKPSPTAAGVFTSNAGTIAPVAMNGSSDYGPNIGAGTNFLSFNPTMAFNDLGQVTFQSTVSGTNVSSANRLVISSGAAGSIHAIARSGTSAPADLGSSYSYNSFYFQAVINNAGTAAFTSVLDYPAPLGETQTRSSVTTVNGSNSTTVAVSNLIGTPLGPQLASSAAFGALGLESTYHCPVINDRGDVAFGATLTGNGITSTNAKALFVRNGDTSLMVARTGEDRLGPHLGSGVYFNGFGGRSIFEPVDRDLDLNARGDVAFRATLTGTDVTSATSSVICLNSTGQPAVLARAGTPTVVRNLTGQYFFNTLSNPLVASNGDVLFNATFKSTDAGASTAVGLFRASGGRLTAVILPSTPIAELNGNGLSLFDQPFLNAAGDFAAPAYVVGGGVTDANDEVVLVYKDGAPHIVVREGDRFDVDPTDGVDFRTVSAINFEHYWAGSNGEDGRGSPFNDNGTVSFALGFTDGTSGVFTATVPEPVSTTTCIVIATCLPRRRRR